MATIITYVCDVSGVNGTNKEDFVDVKISSTYYEPFGDSFSGRNFNQPVKLIHKDVAKRLGLLPPPKSPEEAPAEVTFESKLVALMKEWTEDLVQTHLDNQ